MSRGIEIRLVRNSGNRWHAWIDGDYTGGVGGYRTAGQAVAALLAKAGA